MANSEILDRLSYTSVSQKKTFSERLAHIQLINFIYESPRDHSQDFYKYSPEWAEVRERVIIRDRGMDLGCSGVPIQGKIIVHHINPLVEEDFLNWNVDKLFNEDNLICCSVETHNAIHYGQTLGLSKERYPGDTKLW